ncbi:hypothetical protein [Schleiferilactobacillus harbinensis]|jgi:hypothetical protein|uniref:CHRD domain-containing protein n=1 Tax=Schleiferilactobacillus harbinensis TaxID=304207 RepID=A0A510TZ64_9LACO|nr:hypothetical protein [Schleiferilactobacillus harbinensis]MCI1688431.1 hypothetical protein [Schleiferilactobacillus harbinensis]MCI1783358.1 hypothetical protein [Schleiferilactobacillus harbinensis]MCI1849709.1 hypothetical protein [Schleiferilactobacillus harbinensis]MCT2908078.1 hypothetical protein [Schleiferilactobacillus harbinensis]QFR22296.1 hypothetical protein D1010_01900 [Schleiferilactobacillus harbinensis]
MAEKKTVYEAEITPLNADKIGTAAKGRARFEVQGDEMVVTINMTGTPANSQHWLHFHGFPDGRDAAPATAAQDANGDGYVDLVETESVSGTTMVPFNASPEHMRVPEDTYPVADAQGDFIYQKIIPLGVLRNSFEKVFHDRDLQLDKRVIYVHGVPDDFKLPDTVQGAVAGHTANTTLPIAVGKIKKISD